jgi:hypothetical protein
MNRIRTGRLEVESLDERLSPSGLGLVKVGPQPEPPTVVGKQSYYGILFPVFRQGLAGTAPISWAATFQASALSRAYFGG